MKRRLSVRSFFPTSVCCALSAALCVAGCSSDSLKRTFETSRPSSTGAASPLAASGQSGAASPALVAGVDYTEARAASTAPVGTTYYRGAAGENGSGVSTVPGDASTAATSNTLSQISAPASFVQTSQLAQNGPNGALASSTYSSETASSAVEFQEETRLREELIAARADVKRQIDANESLLRQSATFRRDAEETVAELRRANAELSEKNRVLLASASELQANRAQNERRLQIQNAALRKAPTTVVVPNNSAATLDLKLSDPQILPIRRDGDSAIIELQDELLFEADSESPQLSDEGKKRLRVLATEILGRYPTNVLSIQGHSDSDPIGSEDPLSVQAKSVQKAYLVAEFLVEETGVARNQTIVGGCGFVRPIVSNETETNRRRNRRVEITVLPETVTPRFDSPKTISF